MSLSTLALASVGSAGGTLVIGRFGLAGTLLGAALFPVIVALVKELAMRPARAARPVPLTVRTFTVDGEGGEARIRRVVPAWTRRRVALAVGTGLAAFVVVVAVFPAVEGALGRSLVDDRSTTFFSDPRPPASPTPLPGEEGPDDTPTEPEPTEPPPEAPPPTTEPTPEPPPPTEPPATEPVPTEPPPTEPLPP